jgi:hypothetical protein
MSLACRHHCRYQTADSSLWRGSVDHLFSSKRVRYSQFSLVYCEVFKLHRLDFYDSYMSLSSDSQVCRISHTSSARFEARNVFWLPWELVLGAASMVHRIQGLHKCLLLYNQNNRYLRRSYISQYTTQANWLLTELSRVYTQRSVLKKRWDAYTRQ